MKTGILIITFLVLISFASSNAYAENITTKLWFITTNENGCSIWNIQALGFYQAVTAQYLPMYDLHGYLEEAKCVRYIDVINNYDEFIKARQSVDLPIIVLDHVEATSQLKIMKTEYGHMRFADDERFGIVFGAFASYTVEDKKSAWILSHEISHYALFHKGTPWSVYVDDIHRIQADYDTCTDKQQCTDLWTTITSNSGQLIPVMAPYKETKNSVPIPVPVTPTPNNEKVTFAFPEGKLVVKQDNTVSVKGFAMVGLGENNYLPYAELSLKKYPEGTTISTTTADNYGSFTFYLTGAKNSATYDRDSGISTWDMYVEFAGDSKNKSAKSQTIKLTVVGIIESSIIEKYFPMNDVLTPEPVKKKVVPTWVKNNAELWAGGQIDDEAFVQGLQFLIKEKIINVESAPVTSNDSKGMPAWIKNSAEWWTQGLISEDEFLKGIEYLVEKGIINLD